MRLRHLFGAVDALAVAVVILILLGILSELALAGGPHGNYTNDTDACGSCHNTHAARGKNLIANLAAGSQNEIYRVCTYCHKAGGQSKYDVVNGITSSTKASLAGGFSYVVTAEGNPPTKVPPTSKHDVDAAEGSSFWAPGYSTNPADYVVLTCASYHNPHSGADRALRSPILGVSVSPVMSIMVSGGDESVQYNSGWNDFCGACHKDYKQTAAGSGSMDSGTYSTYKRHRVGMDPSGYPGVNSSSWTTWFLSQPSTSLPLQNDNAGNTVMVCLTCHYAHSTARTNTVTFNRADGTTTSSSALLRQDNRGACEACHNK